MNKDLHLLGQLTTELLLNAEDCGSWLAISGTLVPDDVEMLKRVEAFCQEPKVWMVREDMIFDYAKEDTSPKLFFNYADAKAEFDKCVKDVTDNREEYGYDGWLIEQGAEWYETYPDGRFGSDHYACYLTPMEII